jgi:hypothetical protein
MKQDDISVSVSSSNGEHTKSDESGTYSATSKATHDVSNTTNTRVVLGQKENQLVWRSRMVVLFVLLVATISVAIVTYQFTERAEQEDFKTRVSSRSLATGHLTWRRGAACLPA